MVMIDMNVSTSLVEFGTRGKPNGSASYFPVSTTMSTLDRDDIPQSGPEPSPSGK